MARSKRRRSSAHGHAGLHGVRHRRRSEVHVALTGGFFRDSVQIWLDGLPIFQAPEVTTEAMSGLAASVETVARGPMAGLTVSVPSRGLATSVVVPPEAVIYLGISIEAEHLFCRFSESALGYV